MSTRNSFTLVLFLMLAWGVAHAGDAVVVPNGGMEKVLAGNGMPDLWYGTFGGATHGRIELDRATAHSGAISVKISNQTPAAAGRFALLTSPPVIVKPGTGVLWDGMTNTFVISYANILHGKYGFRVINSRGNRQNLVPQFLNAFGLLLEGADVALSIEAGYEYKITTSDMDMCQGNTVQILPDPAALPAAIATGTVQIVNSRIGNCRKSGVYIDARDVQISNTQLFTTSLDGLNKYPAIAIGPHARDVSLNNVRAEESIGTRLTSYGVSIGRGAKNIMIDNLNANYVNRGAVQNLGGVNLVLGHLIEPDGAAAR